MSTEKKEYGPMYRFIEYNVYQESKKWFQEISSLKGVFESQLELWPLIRSNCISVVMNIASASTKLPQEAKRYLSFSITSANKVVACLDIACDEQLISQEEFQTLSEGYKKVIIQIKSFIKAMGRSEKSEEK